MWHCYVGSICGDTLQQFSISEHVDLCPFITCPPSSVRAACDQENVCPRHRFVCAHSGCVLSPSLPLNEESFCTLINTQILLHFINAIGTQAIKYKLAGRLTSLLNYLLWLSDLIQMFIYYIFFIVVSNSNSRVVSVVTVALEGLTQHSAALSVWYDY